MDRDITNYFVANNVEFIKIMPDLVAAPLPEGCFLNAAFTSKFKANQLMMIADLYEEGLIRDDDRFFFSDIWFPGIESIAYMNYFHKKNAKITGVIHAGSFTDTDFVRDLERWAKNFEDIVFDISETIYCASNFIRDDIIKKRMVDPGKFVVSGLPVDYETLGEYAGADKVDRVVFNGRICDEKQPHLFDKLADRVREITGRDDLEFVKTQDLGLNKDDYYQLLAESKCVVSYALQENFGFGIAEAAYLGCTPVLPNRLVYPELYDEKYLFNTHEESVSLVCDALQKQDLDRVELNCNPLETWFGKG
jgi:glycosyltransferase involved in cell wall biosynthesis